MTKAVVLLSGGLDSAVTAYIAARQHNFYVYPLSFSYGQRHEEKELESSSKISQSLDISYKHPVIYLQDTVKGVLDSKSTSLLGYSEGKPQTDGADQGIPSTWVPQRNMLFLTLGFMYADSIEADYVFAGFNAVDYSGYPDCRPEFVTAAARSLNLARKRYVEDSHEILIGTPIIESSKAQIVAEGLDLGVPFEHTYSCYYGRELSCGQCDSCKIRLQAFKDNGILDPISYETLETVA